MEVINLYKNNRLAYTGFIDRAAVRLGVDIDWLFQALANSADNEVRFGGYTIRFGN